MSIKSTILSKVSPRLQKQHVDVVTRLTTGKGILDLAEEALNVATDHLADAEKSLKKKTEAHRKAQVALEAANTTRNLRQKDFDTVRNILK